MLITAIALSAAQIKALRATPITIKPAPGANKALIPFQATFNFYAGFTRFAIPPATALHLRYAAAGQQPILTCDPWNILDILADAQVQLLADTSTLPYPRASVENSAIELVNPGTAEFTLGDGTLTIALFYSVVVV